MGRGVSHEITRSSAEQLIQYLCWTASVPMPKVRWSTRAVRGSYRCGDGIAIGPRIRDGLYPGLRGRRSWHGPTFIDTLKELVVAWYGSMDGYAWETEYASIRKAIQGRL